jgi:hypothetical protein
MQYCLLRWGTIGEAGEVPEVPDGAASSEIPGRVS